MKLYNSAYCAAPLAFFRNKNLTDTRISKPFSNRLIFRYGFRILSPYTIYTYEDVHMYNTYIPTGECGLKIYYISPPPSPKRGQTFLSEFRPRG